MIIELNPYCSAYILGGRGEDTESNLSFGIYCPLSIYLCYLNLLVIQFSEVVL